MLVDAEMQRLVQTATRTFYEPKFVILIDQLVRKEAMKDEELAARVGTKEKDLAKIAVKLAEDGFLATHRRPELRPGAQKATAKTWYYIDFQRTIDVIKWRMYKIRKVIDDKLRNEIDSQGYVCPRCKKRYSTLDAGSLVDFVSGVMRCDVCGTEVIDNENVDEVKRSKDQMNRLLEQTKPIVDGLRKAETIPLQAFNIAAWLEKHHPIAAADLLQIAASSAPQVVTVELDEGGDEEKRIKKEADADAKRQQNLLPSWIERSTITGELTAAGAAQEGHRSSAGNSLAFDAIDSIQSPTKLNHSNDVDDFYASLAAAQAATAASAAPRSATNGELQRSPDTQASSPLSAAGVSSRPKDSGFDRLGRSQSPGINTALSPRASITDIDVRPSTSHGHRRMPSLRPPSAASVVNSLGKRSRAASEDGSETEYDDKKQRLKADSTSPAAADGHAVTVMQSWEPVEEITQEPDTLPNEANGKPDQDEDASDPDPILQVAGKSMRFSTITEADTADMTPEEYQAYWEAMTSL